MKFTKFLAIDYGEKRAGIAVSDEEKKYSFARGFLHNDKNFLTALLKIVAEENIVRIVLGYPLSLNAEKTKQTSAVEKFKDKLSDFLSKNSFSPEIVYFDERLTSRIAEQQIISSGLSKSKRRDKGFIDSIAAQIILQDYLDKQANAGT